MAVVEQKVDSMQGSIDKLHGKMDSLITYSQGVERNLNTRITDQEDRFDLRYAGKQVERVVYGGVGTILTAVLIALLALIGLKGRVF